MSHRLVMIVEEDLRALFRGEILEVDGRKDVSIALSSFTPFEVIRTACEVAAEILPKTMARRRGELQPLAPSRPDNEVRESLRKKQFADGSFSGPILPDEKDYLERNPRSGPTELSSDRALSSPCRGRPRDFDRVAGTLRRRHVLRTGLPARRDEGGEEAALWKDASTRSFRRDPSSSRRSQSVVVERLVAVA